MESILKSILDGINSVLGNYGWSIIVFTLLIRLVTMPFDFKSRVGMRQQQKIAPLVSEIQKKYAKDQEKMNKKLSELYRKEKINPLSSCLPLLFSMAILWIMFAAMRSVANENLARQAFEILQGNTPTMQGWLWVRNLWMPDSPFASSWPGLATLQAVPGDIWQKELAMLGDSVSKLPLALTADSFSSANLHATIQSIVTAMQAIPAYTEATSIVPGMHFNLWITTVDIIRQYNGFFILPILASVTQLLMTAVQPVTPTTGNEAQQSTGKMMKWFFPLFSLFICSNYNAVFAIYWVASNIIAAAQNYLINWYLDRKEKMQQTSEVTVK